MKELTCEELVKFFPSISEYEELFSTYIANCVVNSFLSYTAIALNILAIYAIFKTSAIPKSLRTLLVSLAVSDVGVGLVSLPFYVSLLVKWFQRNNPTCVNYKSLLNISSFFSIASFLGVVAISVDRFLAFHFHLRYQELVTHKRVIGGVVIIWVWSVVQSTIWFLHEIQGVIFSSIGAICFLITAAVYGRIYVILRRHKNQIETLQVVQETHDCSEMANMARVRKSAVCAFYGYLVFLICYMPFVIFVVVVKVHSPGIVLKGYSLYAGTLMFLNSSLNPVIYCWKMSSIRRTVMDTMRKISWRMNRPSHSC